MKSLWEKTKKRTHLCGEITSNLKDKQVVLNGRVKSLRDHGNLLFADIVDDSGMVQVTFDTKDPNWIHTKQLHYDCIVFVQGQVKKRPENMQNKKIKQGMGNHSSKEMDILAFAKTPPFRQGDTVNENLALQYRYLDLKRRTD